MAVSFPDIINHNNPSLALVDSGFVRGGRRVVTDMTSLFGLSSNTDQLKTFASIVYVQATQQEYLLVDGNNVGNSQGWLLYKDNNASVGTTVTANNGLTETGTNVQLGGNLVQNTIITLNGFIFQIASGLTVNVDGTIKLDSLVGTGTRMVITDAAGNLSTATYTTADIMQVSKWVFKKVPTGAVNSVNTSFSLGETIKTGSEHIFLNGVMQKKGVDYTITDATGVFLMSVAPDTGDSIEVTYLKP